MPIWRVSHHGRTWMMPEHSGVFGARGFSLVELMVALAIGAMLLLTLSRLFVDAKTQAVRESMLSRMQEDARVATTILTGAIRDSRSLPCRGLALHERADSLSIKACMLLPDADDKACATRSNQHLLASTRALGYDNRADLGNPDSFIDLPSAGREKLAAQWLRGDVLVTWSVVGPPASLAAGGSAQLSASGLDTTAPLPVTGLPDWLLPGQPLVLSDCLGADVFAISGPDALGDQSVQLEHGLIGVDGERVNAREGLSRGYQWRLDASYPLAATPTHHASLWPLRYQAHYVCCVDMERGRLLSDGSVNNCRPGDADYGSRRYRPSLCRWDLASNQSVPLINEVADLRLRFFGVDDEGGFGPGTARPESDPSWMTRQGAWPHTHGVFVELLLTTEFEYSAMQEALPSLADWPPAGASMHPDRLGAGLPADQRLYRRFAFGVALRATTDWTGAP